MVYIENDIYNNALHFKLNLLIENFYNRIYEY